MARKFWYAPLPDHLSDFAYQLTQDTQARAASINPLPPTPEAHRAWLLNPHYYRCVGMVGSEPIGICWADASSNDHYIMSVNLAPAWRGQGFGWRFVDSVTAWLRSLRPDLSRDFLAYIRPGHSASIRTFEKAGYRFWQRTFRGDMELSVYVA